MIFTYSKILKIIRNFCALLWNLGSFKFNKLYTIFFLGLYNGLDSQQITDTLKLALMIGDVRLVEEVEGVAGDIYVLDGAVLGASLLARLSPSTIKKFLICVQVGLNYC